MSLPSANQSNNVDDHDRALLESLEDQGPLVQALEEPDPAPAAAAPAVAAPVAQAPAAPAASPAPAPAAQAPATAPAQAPAEAPKGDLRKALRASRIQEQRTAKELEEVKAKLEAAERAAGREPEKDPLDYTPEELEELRDNFPAQHAAVTRLRAVEEENKRLRELNPPKKEDTWLPPVFDDAVQAVIAQVPKLEEWQYSQADQPKFDMAEQFDEALRRDPDWKAKPPVERFAEAVRRTEARFAATSGTPAAVIPTPEETGPKGIGDFRGGGPANAPTNDYGRLTDAQIFADLDRIAPR